MKKLTVEPKGERIVGRVALAQHQDVIEGVLSAGGWSIVSYRMIELRRKQRNGGFAAPRAAAHPGGVDRQLAAVRVNGGRKGAVEMGKCREVYGIRECREDNRTNNRERRAARVRSAGGHVGGEDVRADRNAGDEENQATREAETKAAGSTGGLHIDGVVLLTAVWRVSVHAVGSSAWNGKRRRGHDEWAFAGPTAVRAASTSAPGTEPRNAAETHGQQTAQGCMGAARWNEGTRHSFTRTARRHTHAASIVCGAAVHAAASERERKGGQARSAERKRTSTLQV